MSKISLKKISELDPITDADEFINKINGLKELNPYDLRILFKKLIRLCKGHGDYKGVRNLLIILILITYPNCTTEIKIIFEGKEKFIKRAFSFIYPYYKINKFWNKQDELCNMFTGLRDPINNKSEDYDTLSGMFGEE